MRSQVVFEQERPSEEDREKIKGFNVAIAHAGSFYWTRGGRIDLMIAERIMEANLLALDQLGEGPCDARDSLEAILADIKDKLASSKPN